MYTEKVLIVKCTKKETMRETRNQRNVFRRTTSDGGIIKYKYRMSMLTVLKEIEEV